MKKHDAENKDTSHHAECAEVVGEGAWNESFILSVLQRPH